MHVVFYNCLINIITCPNSLVVWVLLPCKRSLIQSWAKYSFSCRPLSAAIAAYIYHLLYLQNVLAVANPELLILLFHVVSQCLCTV